MNNRFFFSACIICVSLSILNCNNQAKNERSSDLPAANENIEMEKALKIAEGIAFREYGDVIKSELPLKAKLAGDSVWVIEGTLAKGVEGGTVYIELNKKDNRVLKITHYK